MLAKLPRPLPWISRDGKVIIAARGVRGFAQGTVAVLIAVYLANLGFSLVQVGAFFSAGVAGSAFFVFAVGLTAERVGRRRLLVGISLLTAVSSVLLVLTNNVVVLTVFAFFGAFSLAGGAGAGPTQALEQASLADAAPSSRRTDLYAVNNIVATAAAAMGSLAAGIPTLLQHFMGLEQVSAIRVMLVGLIVCLVALASLYALLSPAVEARTGGRAWTNPLRLPSRRIIFTLTALFTVDSFAGSMVLQSLVAYWFNTKFGLELASLAVILFGSQVLAAVSLWLAAKIANRIGLINTMVFTHIPSSLFLLAATFAPTAWMAVLFWQLRSLLGQMDVPTRESYTMAVVGPSERVAMASMHLVGRSIAGTAGPSVATALWQGLSASAPFALCAGLKIAYDVALWVMFRNVKPPEEVKEPTTRVSGRR